MTPRTVHSVINLSWSGKNNGSHMCALRTYFWRWRANEYFSIYIIRRSSLNVLLRKIKPYKVYYTFNERSFICLKYTYSYIVVAYLVFLKERKNKHVQNKQYWRYFEYICRILSRLLRTFPWEIMKRTSSIIAWKKDNLSVYNIGKVYFASLLSFRRKHDRGLIRFKISRHLLV